MILDPVFKVIANCNHYCEVFFAEFIGTAILMYLGCMGCVANVDQPPAFHHMPALSFGLVVMMIIQCFGHISGAHLNPAVTILAVLLKLVTPLKAVVYVVAQFIGALLGFALLKISLPSQYLEDGLCLTAPHPLLTSLQALFIETTITTVLVLVICGIWDSRNADKQDSVPLKFGFVVAALSMVAGPFTGASMNTVRSFAPAILQGRWTYHWIYWVGPNLGAIIGTGMYKFLFGVPNISESAGHATEEIITLGEINTGKEK